MSQGYQYVSLSDALRKEAETLGISHSREDLIHLGQTLRKKEGPGALAARTVAAFAPDVSKYVVDSIRHPAEIEILRNHGHFTLIGIDAPVELRYERAMKRGRDESAFTIEDFKKMEARENTSDELGQQLDKCLEKADILMRNDSTVEALSAQIVAFLSKSS